MRCSVELAKVKDFLMMMERSSIMEKLKIRIDVSHVTPSSNFLLQKKSSAMLPVEQVIMRNLSRTIH